MSLAVVAQDNFSFWGNRVPHEDEALEFCRGNKISIVPDKRQKFGKLKFYRGYVFILINPNLSIGWRLWVLWHEIGHFLLHSPKSSSFSINFKRKHDREANYIAATVLITLDMITILTYAEIQEEFGYPIELIQIRATIAERELNKNGKFKQYRAA